MQNSPGRNGMRCATSVVSACQWRLGACGETTVALHEQLGACRIIVEHGKALSALEFVSLQIKKCRCLKKGSGIQKDIK